MMRRILVAFLVNLIAGCAPPTDWDAIYTEYFENLCGEMPCGWTQSGGPEGAARFVTTAAGARGLEVTGDDVRLRAESIHSTHSFATTITGRLMARCDTGSMLELRASLELSDGSIVTLGGEFAPDVRWRAPVEQTLVFQNGDLSDAESIERIIALQLLKRGTGTCEINGIVLRAFP